jgi:CubicO group peptidase (beta-lactamase class C family)
VRRRRACTTGTALRWVLPAVLLAAATTPRAGTNESLRREIEAYLDGMRDCGYAYAVSVSLEEHVLVQRGYGWSDSSGTCRASERTLFNVASITKSFTAIAAFQLRRQGALRLQDTLPSFFDAVPRDKQSISIEHLMAHTSGLRQNYAADGVRSREEAVRAILSDTLAFGPGTSFSYSNENSELLAAIIEVASGMTFEAFVRTNILDPARMDETRFWHEVDAEAGCAVASLQQTGVRPGVRDWGYVGSGGVFSNVTDLARWFAALSSGTLLPADDLQSMWEERWSTGTTGITRGWFRSRTLGTTEIWTRGTESWGHNAVVRWFPDRRLLVIVATNSGEMGGRQATGNRVISDRIAEIVLGTGAEPRR